MGSEGEEEPRGAANAQADAEAEAEAEVEMDMVELDTRGTLRLSLLGDLDELPWPQRIAKFLNKHYFSLACIAAIAVAAAYPRGGHTGGPIKPEVTSVVVAVVLILFITGLTLPTLEIKHALMRWKVNGYSQFVNIVFFPVFVFLVALALRTTAFDNRLLDGTIILACIPTTVSMSVVMTKTAAGNEAVALCNASAGNVLGVFLTPAWLLGLANAKTTVPFGETILNLTYKVLIPLIVGQVLRHMPKEIFDMQQFTKTYRVYFKRSNETLLAFLVYTTFCDMFYDGTDASAEQIISLTGLLVALHIVHLAVTWWGSAWSFLECNARDRVAVLFVGSQKTLALGIPLISTIYDGSNNLGLYCLPLLIYYPIQLVFATGLLSRLREYVAVSTFKRRRSELKAIQMT